MEAAASRVRAETQTAVNKPKISKYTYAKRRCQQQQLVQQKQRRRRWRWREFGSSRSDVYIVHLVRMCVTKIMETL